MKNLNETEIKKNKEMKISLCIFIVMGILAISPAILSYQTISEYKDVIIEDKERITKSDGDGGIDSYYLIYTNKGVFKNEDSFIHFKFNSSDYQNELRIGEKYDIKVNWFRFSFFSMYENVLEIKEK
jgi:hypothetical protein